VHSVYKEVRHKADIIWSLMWIF